MMKMLSLSLLAAGLLAGHVTHAAVPDIAGIVTVGTTVDVSRAKMRTGFVADNVGHVIAYINAPNETLSVNTTDGAVLTAHTVAYDKTSGLALLKVADGATALKPYTFSHRPAALQRKVYGVKVNQTPALHEIVAGALSGIHAPDTEARSGYYQHNALVGKAGVGGPLFNNCGEVVGVIVSRSRSRSLLARLFGDEPDTIEYAIPIEWLVSQFGALGIQPERATAVCLSEIAQAESAVQAAAAQAELTEKARAAEAVAQADLAEKARAAEAAAQATAEAQAELDAVRNQLEAAQDASEEEKRQLQEEIDARQRTVDEASTREQAAQTAFTASQEKLRETREKLEQAQVREQQYLKWGGSAVALLLALLLLVLILRRRAVNRERREKAAAQAHTEQAQAELAAHERDEARIRSTPAVFLEGTDAVDTEGQRVALRIPGASIATAGAIIGRNPADSDFVINHPQVSRKHFRLFLDENALMIEDLGSTNGTTVDGNILGAGDKIALNDVSRVECGHLHLATRVERE